MIDGIKVSQMLQENMKSKGIIPEPEAVISIENAAKCAKLGESVWTKMQVCGETDESKAYDAIMLYANVLAGRWHGTDVMADRIVKRYYKSHGLPQGRSGGDGPRQDGQSPGQGEQSQGQQGQQGEGQQGQTGQGEGQQGQQGEGQQGQDGQEGQQGQGEQKEQGEEQGEGQQGETPMPMPEPTPDVPRMPDGRIMPKEFPKLVALLKMGKFVMLVGPAGTGKSEMVKDAFTLLGKPLYVFTAPQMSFDITGYVDAQGRYIEKPFSKGFMSGGGVLADEMDRASPEALIAMNAPLANGVMFIEGVGQMTRHKDFQFAATANTAGTGADQEYVTANQLDASTRDRLVFLKVDYDENIDLECARGDKKLVQFAREWRQACKQTGISNALFTYRGIKDFKDLCQTPSIGIPGAVEMVLVKYALPKDTLKSIRSRIKTNNIYAKALDVYISEMEDTY